MVYLIACGEQVMPHLGYYSEDNGVNKINHLNSGRMHRGLSPIYTLIGIRPAACKDTLRGAETQGVDNGLAVV